jgi:hypothetical protein
MSDYEVNHQVLEEAKRRLHFLQGQHPDLSLTNPHNDSYSLHLLTDVLAPWANLRSGVFDDTLEATVRQFQEHYGVHPADGVVRESTWAALVMAEQHTVSELEHKVQATAGQANGYDPDGRHHSHHGGPQHGADHAQPEQVHQYLNKAAALIAACNDDGHPLLAINLHNDSDWVQVVVDTFNLFDTVDALFASSSGAVWGNFHDGRFDHTLQEAVSRYQNSKYIVASGQVDFTTWHWFATDLTALSHHLHALAGG